MENYKLPVIVQIPPEIIQEGRKYIQNRHVYKVSN